MARRTVDAFFEDVESTADYVMAHSYGGYTTNLPLEDLLGRQGVGGLRVRRRPARRRARRPVRLLVPHLYLWKRRSGSAAPRCMTSDEPGFWEGFGYHNYGDPWREERY